MYEKKFYIFFFSRKDLIIKKIIRSVFCIYKHEKCNFQANKGEIPDYTLKWIEFLDQVSIIFFILKTL